jgi:hypothetical protein
MMFEGRMKPIEGETNPVIINYELYVIRKDSRKIDQHREIVTKPMVKQWNFKSNERIVCRGKKRRYVDSVPYGFWIQELN